jgi:hypothetical protein
MVYSPEAILNHLKIYLPLVTDLFTDKTQVVGNIVAGSPQILRITRANHGKSVGNTVKFADSKLDNGINAVSDFVDNGNIILRFTTNVAHDLTMNYDDNLTDGLLELRGFTDSSLNGFFDLYDVPSSTIFEIIATVVPTLNGNEVLRENRQYGVNESYIISDVPDANTYDVELTGLPTFDTKEVYNLYEVDNYRMSIISTWERAQEIYTKQDPADLWLYLIMENVILSKDRRTESDAVNTNTTQNVLRNRYIGQFSLNVVIPTPQELAAVEAVQISYDEVYLALLAVMSGVKIETFETNFLTTMISHGMVRYNHAYYAHNYTFEQTYDATYEDQFVAQFQKTVAFRRINISFADKQDGSNIILDEEE